MHTEQRYKVFTGDNLTILRELAENSVDAIVTDPPAGIGFMQRDWDSDKGGRDKWIEWMSEVAAECLRVIKPGGHALVWALPRTSHWTATAWENAGWEPRDRICHIFSTGFPKSANISKHIDRMAGAEREVIGKTKRDAGSNNSHPFTSSRPIEYDLTAPATDAAKQWDGWGTALKPAYEMWMVMRKPVDIAGYGSILICNIIEMEAVWKQLVKLVQSHLKPSPVDLLGEKINIVHVNAPTLPEAEREKKTAIGKEDAASLNQDTLASMLVTANTVLSMTSLWKHTLGERCLRENTSTTLTGLKTITVLQTLNSWTLALTQSATRLLESPLNGQIAPVLHAVNRFNDLLASLNDTQMLSVVENATKKAASLSSSDSEWHVSDTAKVNNLQLNEGAVWLFRKPIEKGLNIAQNVLKWGTGGLNIDGCRVGTADDMNPRDFDDSRRSAPKFSRLYRDKGAATRNRPSTVPNGRWPAHLIHDGGDEVEAVFPVTGPSKASARGGTNPNPMDWGGQRSDGHIVKGHDDQGGSASRFFYCAKPGKRERDAGLEELEQQSRNVHPTVKALKLMTYLCRLITPPDGLILDPFTGSGSTGCAAMLEGFRFVGMEQSPEYAQIALKRIEYWSTQTPEETVIDERQEKLFATIG